MAYIGNQPASAFASTEKQTITGNGTAGPYALTHEVAAATDIACFVNNVRQEPGVAYTVSGNQMTMTGNVASTDDFYVVYIGRVVGTVNHPANAPLSATTGTFSGDLSVDTDTLHVDSANSNVGIGLITPSPAYKVHVDGNSNSDGRLARFSQAGTDNAIVDVTAQNGTNTEAVIRYRNDSTYYSVGIDSDDSFAIGESFANTIGNKRLIIDTNGSVTMPNQPHIILQGSNGNNKTWNQSDRIGATNDGTSAWHVTSYANTVYNSNTGSITFSAAGVYAVYLQAYYNGGGPTNCRIHIRKNGGDQAMCHNQSISHGTLHVTALVSLAANNYIDFVHISGGDRDFYEGTNHTCAFIQKVA